MISSWIVVRRLLKRVALLPEAGKLRSRNLILSAATVKADNSAVRNDRDESDSAELGAEPAGCSVSVGETRWVLQLVSCWLYYRTTACNMRTLNRNY